MSGIEERYPNNMSTNARFTFWSYFSSDQYVELHTDFVQAKHQVRIDSQAARRMLESTIKAKVLRDKTQRENASTGPARALVIWQRRVMP